MRWQICDDIVFCFNASVNMVRMTTIGSFAVSIANGHIDSLQAWTLRSKQSTLMASACLSSAKTRRCNVSRDKGDSPVIHQSTSRAPLDKARTGHQSRCDLINVETIQFRSHSFSQFDERNYYHADDISDSNNACLFSDDSSHCVHQHANPRSTSECHGRNRMGLLRSSNARDLWHALNTATKQIRCKNKNQPAFILPRLPVIALQLLNWFQVNQTAKEFKDLSKHSLIQADC